MTFSIFSHQLLNIVKYLNSRCFFFSYLFIADWSQTKPAISRSYLDGSHYEVLFDSSTVTWPNGVTVDLTDDRIFWTDAKLDYIASSALDGKGMKYILRDTRVVPHPFAVVVYKVRK